MTIPHTRTLLGGVAVLCAAFAVGCDHKPPRLVLTEESLPGVNTETAEYQNGSAHVVSRVAHFYNSPTGDRSESGDFTAVFRGITGKELPQEGAVRTLSALLTALEKEGVKLTPEPSGQVASSGVAPKVRAFTVRNMPP